MDTDGHRMLMPVRLDRSSPQNGGDERSSTLTFSETMTELFTPAAVVVLGYWPVPDQSSPRQLREQFGSEAREKLDAIVNTLTDQGVETTSELSFTKDRDQLIDRAANKHDCDWVLVPGTLRSRPPSSVLVLLTSDSDLDRIVSTLGALFEDTTVDIVLFHAVESGDNSEAIEYMLRGVADQLSDLGIDPDRIQWELSDRGSRVDTIVSRVSEHDLVALSESEPTVRERVFGPIQSNIADRTDRPELTIRANHDPSA